MRIFYLLKKWLWLFFVLASILFFVINLIFVSLAKKGLVDLGPKDYKIVDSKQSKSSYMIGVLKIRGVIYDSLPVIEKIRKLKYHKKIKAVVVRINSPGGAVAPSQEIYRELKKLSKIKPVVVSMGTVATSGAYYVSIAGQKIFALPGTITGSIGVIMQFAYLKDLYKFLKYEPVVIKSGKYKDMAAPYKRLSDEERQLLQGLSDDIYYQFLADVKRERKLSVKMVKLLADGKVYTGRMAKKLHLIDYIGSFEDAVVFVAKQVGIKDGYPKLYYPIDKKPIFRKFDVFFDRFFELVSKGSLMDVR